MGHEASLALVVTLFSLRISLVVFRGSTLDNTWGRVVGDWAMKYLGPPQSGSQADTVASHNRAGQYYRNRRMPVQPVGSGRRAFIRNAFGTASATWGTLSPSEQAAWTSFAAGHPVTDSLGQSIVLTGQQMFVRCTTTLNNVGLPFNSTPPADLTFDDLSTSTLVLDLSSGFVVDAWTQVGAGFIAVAFSRPVSPGVGFMKTFWQPLGVLGYVASAGAPYTLTAANYGLEFGLPVVGQKIFVRLTPCSSDGWNGTPTIISGLVVA